MSKPLFAGAAGISLAALCFASDAYAFKYHPVGGWARPPSVMMARPNIAPIHKPIIPYKAPIIPYKSAGATVTTGSMPIVKNYRQAQWQRQGQQLHQVLQNVVTQKQQQAQWQQQGQKFQPSTLQQQTAHQLAPVSGQVQNVRCSSLDDKQCLAAAAAANRATAIANGIDPNTGYAYPLPPQPQQPSWQQQSWPPQQQQSPFQQIDDQKQIDQQNGATRLKGRVFLATTPSQLDDLRYQNKTLPLGPDPSVDRAIDTQKSSICSGTTSVTLGC